MSLRSSAFGIDFGTSNSAVAMSVDGVFRFAEFVIPDVVPAPLNQRTASTTPSVLFAPTRDRATFAGYEAIAQYLLTARDGRFIQSMKAFLPKSTFTGTSVGGRVVGLEDLIALFLERLIRSSEQSLGRPLDGPVVLGRPARYSLDPEEEALAEARFRSAIDRVGIKEFELVIEPIAAALAYEAELTRDETVLVVDLGGGTSDFTVMRLGPSYRSQKDDSNRILATGGIPVAGDAFDGEIVEAALFERFGYGSRYRAFTEMTPVPHWIFQKLKRWNHVSFLKEKSYLEFLRTVERTSNQRDAIQALLHLVEDDLGYVLFRAVERAKRGLAGDAEVRIEDDDLPVSADLSIKDFRNATQALLSSIRETALGVLKDSQLSAQEVDAVFMTGGTSLVEDVQDSFRKMFGPEKLKLRQMFTSVAHGLAARASTLR